MKEQIPLYSYSGEYAYEHGELKQFHASYQANVACKEAIEQAIMETIALMLPVWIRLWSVLDMRGSFMSLRIPCSGRNGTGVFPAIIKNGRKQCRSLLVMAAIKTLILFWTAVIPD